MNFEQDLRATVGPLATVQRKAWHGEEPPGNAIALLGPYTLRRFADMAAAFDAPPLRAAQGAIVARRDAHGYHIVEFVANDLHIALEVINGAAHLFWLAGGRTDDRPITAATTGAAIDAMLLAAISAYVETHAAVGAMPEERAPRTDPQYGP